MNLHRVVILSLSALTCVPAFQLSASAQVASGLIKVGQSKLIAKGIKFSPNDVLHTRVAQAYQEGVQAIARVLPKTSKVLNNGVEALAKDLLNKAIESASLEVLSLSKDDFKNWGKVGTNLVSSLELSRDIYAAGRRRVLIEQASSGTFVRSIIAGGATLLQKHIEDDLNQRVEACTKTVIARVLGTDKIDTISFVVSSVVKGIVVKPVMDDALNAWIIPSLAQSKNEQEVLSLVSRTTSQIKDIVDLVQKMSVGTVRVAPVSPLSPSDV